MDLRDATSVLLRDERIATWLRLADTHIQAYNKLPGAFVLPADHAILKPIIEAFAYDAGAFSQYVRALRDGVDGLAKDELHDLYRTVSVRALQIERRARIRKGALALQPQVEAAIGRPLSYNDQVVLARVVEQRWGAMRVQAMAAERESYRAKRLPSEDRAEVLARFWSWIDSDLEAGRCPLDITLTDAIKMAKLDAA